MNYYFLVPLAEVTTAMVNVSTSRRIEHLRIIKKRGLLVNTAYAVIEAAETGVPSPLLNYTAYTAAELQAELNNESVWAQ